MRTYLLYLGISLSFSLVAQHELGLRTDTYAGISGVTVNPAATGRTPWSWDIQLGGASQFFSNNYVFVEDASNNDLLRALRASDTEFTFRGDLGDDFDPKVNRLIYDFREADRYYLQSQTNVLGPGFSVQVAPYTRVGLFSAWYTHVGIDNVDGNLGYYQWNDIPTQTTFRLSEAQLSGAAWGEVGLNISQGFPVSNGTSWFGLSVRRLWGQRATYLRSNANFSLEKLPGAIGLEGLGFELEGGFTENIVNEEVSVEEQSGSGWGLDFGWWCQVPASDDYKQWEFGLALLDLGGIRFTDAQTHSYTSNDLVEVLQDDYDNFDLDGGIDAVAEQFSQDVLGLADSSRTGNSFRLRLATSLSGQVRYNFNPYFGIEAAVVTGFGAAGPALKRETAWALTPRFDRHWWSVALPLSLYAGQELRLGLSARLGPIVVGTDHLGSFLGAEEWNGTDAYFAIKWFPLGLGDGGGRSGRRRGKGVECYQF